MSPILQVQRPLHYTKDTLQIHEREASISDTENTESDTDIQFFRIDVARIKTIRLHLTDMYIIIAEIYISISEACNFDLFNI